MVRNDEIVEVEVEMTKKEVEEVAKKGGGGKEVTNLRR